MTKATAAYIKSCQSNNADGRMAQNASCGPEFYTDLKDVPMDLTHDSARLIIDACLKYGLLRNQAAYVLGTAWHETGRFKYMREIWGPTPAQKRYEARKDIGNVVAGDGKKFIGRGFVQITGRRNYTDWGRRLGLDLLKEPQVAERPDIAARVIVEGMKLGTFTGKKLADYIDLQKSDFVSARRIVNGLDKADLIASYAREFDALLKAKGYGESTTPKPGIPKASSPKTGPESITPREPAKGLSFWAQFLATILRYFTKG